MVICTKLRGVRVILQKITDRSQQSQFGSGTFKVLVA